MKAILYEFYDPHPGLAGCAVPIPEPVRALAESASGTRVYEVAPFCERVQKAMGAGFTVTDTSESVLLKWGDMHHGMHCWRVIRYRPVEKARRRNRR